MYTARYMTRGILLVAALLLLSTSASAEWRVTIESKIVPSGALNVPLNVNIAFDLDLNSVSVPVIVRQLTPGSFWTGELPYDTNGGCYLCDFSRGVEWHWINAMPEISWYASLGFQPGVPLSPCETSEDIGYDGLSPDHFVIYASGTDFCAPAAPDGYDVVTMTFNVTEVPGEFEFDTSCFSNALFSLFLIDCTFPPVDHGPLGTNECIFEKGVITIVPCYCGVKGDLNNDGRSNPLDVIYLVNKVYREADNLVYPENWDCPYPLGDFDCSGGVNPLDAHYFANLIYCNRDYTCSPCAGD